MSSIIEGYNYDIFISYRQKDNKYDGWVTEFVNNLRKELEATFKEEISVYFDINPFDGLLETHDVDESLKEKLKCLIFIPIISRTYCDSKSFAWEHEFKAFVNLASNDQFGLKVKLPNGNVASRVLPVRIHDLDSADIKECESVLGGVLRGIEFIYKESGVNKPLTGDDDEKKNLNNTKYRIQINKVANAINEVITAIKQYGSRQEEVPKEVIKQASVHKKNQKIKIISGFVIVLTLIILGFLLVPRLLKPRERLEKSIAVLPFRNDSPDTTNKYFIDGTMEAILNNLCKIEDFKVISRTSVEQFRNTALPVREIAKRLDVNYILEGSGQKFGNNIRLTVQLIDAVNDKHIWSYPYEGKIKEVQDIYNLESQIAAGIAKELEAAITPQTKEFIEKPPTLNLGAYDAYLRGNFFYEKNNDNDTEKAISWFKEAIKLDSTFALPWTYLSMCYWRHSYNADAPEFRDAKLANEEALELDPTSAIAIVNMAEILDNEYDFKGAEEKIKQALKIDPDNPYVLRNAGRFYTLLGEADKSISYCDLALKNDPNNETALHYLARAYFYAGRLAEAWKVFKKHQELEYTGLEMLYYQLLLEEGNFERIIKEPALEGAPHSHLIALAAANFALGNKTEGETYCNTLIAENIQSFFIAFAYAYSDEPLKVNEWLDKSYTHRERKLTFLGVDPAFRKYRNDPQIKALLGKMGFPDK